ncbi:hypothetical protein TRV_00009 [Trichophyton verrucosum HKI 0517]|uniref:Uncharacterized protein n=1 Tax=Trichophyton verrucosum (strain HKI 0517) TaxID=663202 RepID=D4CYX2_TRIVH|nr:uncharacterized protein TRV_00009 [Trichophyton verrucosum HKI 0517]EFE45195.1 hypothetical protein TRV_00009 [Trichophyton verrucosum HKI 0517]
MSTAVLLHDRLGPGKASFLLQTKTRRRSRKEEQEQQTQKKQNRDSERGRDSEKGGGYLGYLEPYPRAMGGRGTSKDRAAGRTAQQRQGKAKKKKTTREKEK